MDNRYPNPIEARKQAAARVKARLKKEQKLPWYNRNRKPFKAKKLKKTSKTVESTRPPWNDRFYVEHSVPLDNVRGGPSRHSDCEADGVVTNVFRPETDNPEIQGLSIYKSLTERKDGSPIMTTIIHQHGHRSSHTRTRAVSPFDIRKMNRLLTEEGSKRTNKRSDNVQIAMKNNRDDYLNPKKQTNAISNSRATNFSRILNQWQSIKAHSKLNATRFFLMLQTEFNSTEAIVERIVDSLLEDLLREVVNEMDEVLQEFSNAIVNKL